MPYRTCWPIWAARDEHFGNGRLVRNLFERVQQQQANRLSIVADPTREQLATIEPSDVLAAAQELISSILRAGADDNPQQQDLLSAQ